MSVQSDWRDGIRVHPAADLFPMISDAELDELASDIAQNGLHQQIVWLYGEPQHQLLDGRNRIAAITRIADTERREQIRARIKDGDDSLILNDVDPYAYVVSANIRRRHLTAAQKRSLVAKLLETNPNQSDRAIAKMVKVDHKTVATVRAKKERRGEIPHVETRADTKGRQQSAKKPTRRTMTSTTSTSLAQQRNAEPASSGARNEAIIAIEKKRPADIVDAFIKICRDAQKEMLSIAEDRRLELVFEMAEVLGFGREDLRRALDGAADAQQPRAADDASSPSGGATKTATVTSGTYEVISKLMIELGRFGYRNAGDPDCGPIMRFSRALAHPSNTKELKTAWGALSESARLTVTKLVDDYRCRQTIESWVGFPLPEPEQPPPANRGPCYASEPT